MILTFRHYALLAVLTFCFALAGRMSLPPLDRDEPRYMEATQQMIHSGNYVDIHFQDQPRYLQPAGIYWLEAIPAKLAQKFLGENALHQAWVYRIPSLIAASLIVPLTAWMGALLFSGSVGLLASLFLMVSLLFVAESHMATIDTVLLLIILSAEALLLKAYFASHQKTSFPLSYALSFWGLLGIGMMLKGPIPLIPILGTIFTLSFLEKNWKIFTLLRASWGWLLSLTLLAPWCLSIYILSHGEFFHRAVSHNLLGKITHGQESHGFLPGYYLIIFLVSFWPGSLFAVQSIPHIFIHRREKATRFLLCWILPHWLFFELLATKLPHYVLPTYPAIALLSAASLLIWSQENITTLEAASSLWRKIWEKIIEFYSVIWGIVSLCFLFLGSFLLIKYEHLLSIRGVLACIGSLPLLFYGLKFFYKNEKIFSAYCMIGAAFLTEAGILLAIIPYFSLIQLSPHIAQQFQAIKPCAQSQLISNAYSEPSLVFLIDEKTKLISSLPLASDEILKNPACSIILLKTDQQTAFKKLITSKMTQNSRDSFHISVLSHIEGMNYSTGKTLKMDFLRLSPSSRP